jgi:hypothetical protein
MSASTRQEGGRRARALRWIPYLLALLFVVNSLRSLPCGNPIDTDAARHIMNGAFVHDLVKNGDLKHPIQYGKLYYSRLPGVSLPYHPPLFPAIEAALFLVFGVKLAVARVAVAAGAGIAVLLLYRLVLATHGSHAVAAASVLAFFAWGRTQAVSNDVMLEIPALAFVLGALYAIRRLDAPYSLRTGIAFAALAGAAVWTKQTAVFLGAVPFGIALLARRWRLLAGPAIWASSVLFAGIVFGLTLLTSEFHWTGVTIAAHTGSLPRIVAHNIGYYAAAIAHNASVAFAVAAAAAAGVALWRTLRTECPSPDEAFYLAWAFAALGVPLIMSVYDERYLFLAMPPLAVMVFSAVERLGRAALGASRAWLAPVAIAGSLALFNLAQPLPFLTGPSIAARVLAANAPARIVYGGRSNGAFIFGLRETERGLENVVIRADKLTPDTFPTANFEAFAHRFGVNYVVLERTSMKRRWDALFDSPPPSMVLVREIAISSSDALAKGRLRIFRFTNPAPTPADTLKLRIKRIGADLEVSF